MISFLPCDHWNKEKYTRPPDAGTPVEHFLYDSGRVQIFESGRAALDQILISLRLTRSDEVWITTTFDLPNISSCVTCTIFNHCRPSRVLGPSTRAIFVIHEFGVPHPRIAELSELASERGIPLIEDCAHTISSRSGLVEVGSVGTWAIVSFPKVFPMKFGGAIVGPSIDWTPSPRNVALLDEIHSDMIFHRPMIKRYADLRRDTFFKLYEKATSIGIEPLFLHGDGVVPWMFPIWSSNAEDAMIVAKDMGVDCARWHGSDLIVLPCHQCLTSDHVQQIEKLFWAITEK